MPVITPTGGGGGGSAAAVVGVVLGVISQPDIGPAGVHPVKWEAAWDNVWDFNALAALPTGIGLTAAIDGSSASITTTTAGTWAVAFFAQVSGDITYQGILSDSFVAVGFGGSTGSGVISATYSLPSGAIISPQVTTAVPATTSPFTLNNCLAIISRLA